MCTAKLCIMRVPSRCTSPPPPMANRREADVARSLRPRIEGEEGVEVGVGMRLDSGSRGGECIEPPDMGGGGALRPRMWGGRGGCF